MARKGHFVFFLSFFFFHEGGALGNRRVPLERLVPLSFHGGSAHVRVHATKRYHPLTGASSNYGWLPAKSNPCNVHVYTQKHSFSCVRSGETRKREREKTKRRKRKKGTDDRGWLKWINDRRTREKYAVETEGLDIVTSTFSR